jgi:hypothetical protein
MRCFINKDCNAGIFKFCGISFVMKLVEEEDIHVTIFMINIF